MWRVLCAAQFFILLVIYTYLGLTSSPEGYIPVYNDLLMHFTGYTLAAFSISFAYPLWSLQNRALFLIIYSIAIEIGQHFNPPRTFSGMDILANISGVILGLIVLLLLAKYLPWFNKLLYLKTLPTNKDSTNP
jgi:VanZ family protein